MLLIMLWQLILTTVKILLNTHTKKTPYPAIPLFGLEKNGHLSVSFGIPGTSNKCPLKTCWGKNLYF